MNLGRLLAPVKSRVMPTSLHQKSALSSVAMISSSSVPSNQGNSSEASLETLKDQKLSKQKEKYLNRSRLASSSLATRFWKVRPRTPIRHSWPKSCIPLASRWKRGQCQGRLHHCTLPIAVVKSLRDPGRHWHHCWRGWKVFQDLSRGADIGWNRSNSRRRDIWRSGWLFNADHAKLTINYSLGVAKAFDDVTEPHPKIVDFVKTWFKTDNPNAPALKLAQIPSKAKLNFGVDKITGREIRYRLCSRSCMYVSDIPWGSSTGFP